MLQYISINHISVTMQSVLCYRTKNVILVLLKEISDVSNYEYCCFIRIFLQLFPIPIKNFLGLLHIIFLLVKLSYTLHF